ncbi:gamma-glutamyltransferase [Legionella yabuuchiae]|uniref:gamma-glutamyltransferase n=1 Tax=Legionella yabuuchiae TaxID=376727 RepID=UPI001F5F000E|nr:gamma-glutamyltransferase [Legionella yabuuchiae]
MAKNPSPLPPGYAVASAHPLATQAGLEILSQGGNAFDAAVAVSAALAVVEPYHSGLGGGGFWLLHVEKTKKDIFIDGREVAPLAATPNMFLDAKGNPIQGLSLNGGLSAAIPGEPAALVKIAQDYGHLPLAKSLEPAIRLAEEGFVVDHHLVHFFHMGDRLEQLKQFPGSAAVFLKEGNKPYQVGERLYQRDLAKTLRKLAEEGKKGFYQGEVAEKLVRSVNQAGGIWTLQDLKQYEIKVRQPYEGYFHQIHVISAPLPSAGGVGLITMLNILSAYPLERLTKAQWIHYVVEAMRLTYWQRAELLADPDFVKVSINALLSQKNADYLRSFIKPNQATANSILSAKQPQNEHHDTTHFSILDGEGNRVAATLTINFIFGSSVVAEGTGVLLNDEMDDFVIKPGVKNVFGLIGNDKNGIEPGKRPLSSMAPTFLELPNRLAILGTPGGSRIPTMVLLASLAFHDSYGAIRMVSEMRFHHQYRPDWLMFEPDAIPPDTQNELKQMGYTLRQLDQYYGDMQAITWDYELNLITPASDPRNIGQATVVTNEKKQGYGLMH